MDKSKNKCFIMVDFNIDLLDVKNENTETYVESMFDYNFYPLVNKPTRITKDRCSCIDHILTNMIGSQIKSAIVAHEISDHLPVIQVSNVGIPLLKYENNEGCFSQPNLANFTNFWKQKPLKMYTICLTLMIAVQHRTFFFFYFRLKGQLN